MDLLFPANDNDHAKGRPDAPVTIVEYGDYECPFCKASELLVDALEEAIGADLRLVFRHFPVTSLHPHAESAAEAAEAAGKQAKFWEMHKTLFAHQDALGDSSLGDYAVSLGLDLQQFRADTEGHIHRQKVRQDLLGGLRTGVRGTPTFFIDGQKYDAPPDLQAMLGLVRTKHPELAASIKPVAAQIHVPSMTKHQP